jgi:poly(3-hydroxybutyrate) depolymerase
MRTFSARAIFYLLLFMVVLNAVACFAQSPVTIIAPAPRPEHSPMHMQSEKQVHGGLGTTLQQTAGGKRKDMLQSLRKEFAELDKLTAELKEAVEKSGANQLSLDVIKKTEQLEKLAKKIRSTYKQAY